MDEWNQAIQEIKNGLSNGVYKNETAVSQSIVRRLIGLLGWNIDDPTTVYPEYDCAGNGRVDYALLDDNHNPKILVEVKATGLINDGVTEQLVKYAFGTGAPIIILTDGKEWHFFFAAAGSVPMLERRFYKIDLSDRNSEDIYNIMQQYIGKESVLQGEAAKLAEQTYYSASAKRKAKNTLPVALRQLVESEDDELYRVISEKVADISGVSPEKTAVSEYLKAIINPQEPKTQTNTAFLKTDIKLQITKHKKSKTSSFAMLKIPAGSILTAVFNPSLQFQTLDEKNSIKDLQTGEVKSISGMAEHYLGGSKNGFENFMYNGKKLSDIRSQFDPGYLKSK